MVLYNAFWITAIVLFGLVGSPSLASAAQPPTCDVLDAGCPVTNSAWSGFLIVTPAPSTRAQPPSFCLKISRSLNVIPGTLDGDGCVQIIGVLDNLPPSSRGGAVSGHYCRSNGAIDLFRVMPGTSGDLQPDILIGLVTLDQIRGRIYVKKSNDPDEVFSGVWGFELRLVDECPSN